MSFWDLGKKIILAKGIVKNEDLMTIIWDTNFDQLVLEMVQSFWNVCRERDI